MKANRWTQYKFSNGKVAKNRVVVPPMASQTADSQGHVTDKTLEHYKRLSLSQAGLIFVEYSFVHKSGKGELNQLGVDSDANILGLQKIAEVIQKSGALAGLQIVHAGGKTDPIITGQSLIGASPVAVPVKGWQPEVPVEVPFDSIKSYIQWYVDAAHRTWLAGFDFVELHAAHGYGLNQWLSPLTNLRKDEYGGSGENRARLLIEVVRAIKAQLPELLISVRIPAQDYIPGGLMIKDMQIVAKDLESVQVDLINVSSGIGGWRRPEGRNGEGYLVQDASQIKLATSLPIIGVGGIENGNTIDQMLLQQKLDFAAIGRAILKDPEAWFRTQLVLSEFGADLPPKS